MIQPPAERQDRVPQHLRLQPSPVHPPQITVLGVCLGTDLPLRVLSGLAVSLRGEHQFVHRLDAPLFLDEPNGKPVEQFRMSRPLPVDSEIAWSANQSLAEMVLPEAVDHDPRRKWILGACNPFGQCQSAACTPLVTCNPAAVRNLGIFQLPGETLRKARIDLFTFAIQFASRQHVCVYDIGHFWRDHVRHGTSQRLMAFQQLFKTSLFVLRFQISGPDLFAEDGVAPLLEKGIWNVQLRQELLHRRVVFRNVLHLPEPCDQLLLPAVEFLGCPLHLILVEAVSLPHLPRALRLEEGSTSLIPAGGGEEGLHPVEILLGDGIVLMVVALRASYCHSQKDRTGGLGDLVQEILPQFSLGVRISFKRPHSQKAQSHQPFRLHVLVRFQVLDQFITGQLFFNENVKGRVPVERADDIIPVSPGRRPFDVGGKAVRLCIAHQIQPVARPTFSVAGIVEESIDQFLVTFWVGVMQKAADLLGRGRQPDQVEV